MLIVTVMNPQLQMVPLLQTTKRLWWSGNMMKDDYGSDDEEELFIKETPHNYGSDDHEPRDITVASTDEINTVSKELQLKAFLILARTISACSTSARKQDDLRQLADSSRPDQHVGQLAFPISAIRQLATTSARAPISSSSRSDQFQLAVHLFGGPFNPT
ncbi:hypothetical protein DY000_02034237 [Brassica cretica]|uniref:Uncharacterized protein n=1 Tax=Brassica cretica TaxID=69181 RepID=A0ABQ7DE94_BRACR|nr:hypothetical protein DY000_02034237 [Brassica cretica]